MKRTLALLSALTISLLPIANAEAHGRVFVGGGVVVGQPYYPYPPYYGYPYYAYPPAPYPGYTVPYGYAPPPGYPAPPPGAYPPAAGPEVPPPAASDHYYHDDRGEYCREYNRTITVDGRKEKAYGNACRQPDGQWRLVN